MSIVMPYSLYELVALGGVIRSTMSPLGQPLNILKVVIHYASVITAVFQLREQTREVWKNSANVCFFIHLL